MKVPRPAPSSGFPKSQNFSVSGGIRVLFALIVANSKDRPVLAHHHGPHGNFTLRSRLTGEGEGLTHQFVPLRACSHAPTLTRTGVVPRYASTMHLQVIDHPLVDHKLTVLRNKNTPSATFRSLVGELVTLLTYEATRNVSVEPVEIETPVEKTTGVMLTEPQPLVVPILRAGLGMLQGMTEMLPTAEVGFLGMRRDEDSLEIETYARRLPDDLSGREVYVLDPMLATGHTLVATINYLIEHNAKRIVCICILATPEGIAELEEKIGDRADVTVVTAALDQGLNSKSYIVPGLGDAGDRLYGVID